MIARFKEHLAYVRFGRIEKLSVAQLIIDDGYGIGINNLKLIKKIR